MCVCLQCTIIKMSDLNLNDDLLNYELGDDIDDQALYGSDEDELLLSDDELEKDVSKEVKQQLKAEAEQWVKSQIQDKEQQQRNGFEEQQNQQATTSQNAANMESNIEATPTAEVTSTAVMPSREEVVIVQGNVSTSEKLAQNEQSEFKEPTQSQPQSAQFHGLTYEQNKPQTQMSNSNTDEVTSSSSKDIEMDHSSVISCSTSNFTDTSSLIQSSQDSSSIGMGPGSGDFSDPREDIEEDEREVRTNIKTTNERDIESGNCEQSPDKHHARFMTGKRGGPLLRSHPVRGSYHSRPLLRYPHPHGQFQSQQPPHPYAPHATPHAPAAGPGGVASQQTQNPNTSIPMHQHDPMNLNHMHRPRHPYPGFRPGGPFGFRHPNPASIYSQVPHDYNTGNGSTPFNQNFGHMSQPTRAMFRPELPGGPMIASNSPGPGGPGGMPISMRPGMRFPRPPLQNLPPHGMSTNYLGGPGLRQQQPHPSPQPPLQLAPGVLSTGTGVIASAPAGQSPQLPSAGSSTGGMPATALRPSKVLINPNFKGGVKAATNKFIKETQFMSTISSHVSHLASDDELLRQQEEFINKNREHIEKRRNERVSPLVLRRTRSRSRTRSHSRERSYTPPNKRGGHFERERERERERGDRERERGMERGGDRGGSGTAGNRGSRFRRGNSRDRDYEKRGGSGGNYGKRRRSLSPLPSRGGAGSSSSRRVGAGERDRNDVEEDEETRVYRLEIEKQKMLREKILRDKELKRRRAAEEKLHEEKRTTQSNINSSINNINTSDEQLEPQKLKPIIVTERRIISLKRRQQQQQQQRSGELGNAQQKQTLRKQLPTAKILPEAKRTLTDHLTNAACGVAGGGSGGGADGGGGGCGNTAIIKPVLKKDTHTHTPTPPPITLQKHTRRLSTPSDDEVELDYDEDELMLEEEDRLLATPTPSPPALPVSRTPTPEPTPAAKLTIKPNRSNTNTTKMASMPFSSSNRRVVLKSSSSSGTSASSNSRKEVETTTDTGRSRRSGGASGGRSSGNGGNSNNASISSSRKGIFDRLDARRQLQTSHSTSGDGKRSGKGQRIVLKHD